MGFLSPLEALADKFNIINHNTRELLFKLGVWSSTTADSVLITLKTQDAPYFETYKIPSMQFIASNGKKTNWGNFKPEGTKNWGSTITAHEYVRLDGKYYIDIDAISSPKTHFMEYSGAGAEGDVQISLFNTGADINSMLEFMVTIKPTTNNPTGTHFIYFKNGATDEVLLKLGSTDLINLIESVPVNDGRKYPKRVKVSFQYVIKPGDITPTWVIFDLYQIPRYEYDVQSSTMKPISY